MSGDVGTEASEGYTARDIPCKGEPQNRPITGRGDRIRTPKKGRGVTDCYRTRALQDATKCHGIRLTRQGEKLNNRVEHRAFRFAISYLAGAGRVDVQAGQRLGVAYPAALEGLQFVQRGQQQPVSRHLVAGYVALVVVGHRSLMGGQVIV